MIIVPKKQALYKHTDPETFEIDYLGPVFDKEFLHEVNYWSFYLKRSLQFIF